MELPPLQGIPSLPRMAEVSVHPHAERSSLKNPASCKGETACEETSGPHTWGRAGGCSVTSACGPRASPADRQGQGSVTHYSSTTTTDLDVCPSPPSSSGEPLWVKGNKRDV